MPSEQVLREEAALVEQATATDQIKERTGFGGFKSGITGLAMRMAISVLELTLVRHLIENLTEEFNMGSTVKEICRNLRREVRQEMGYIPEGSGELIRASVRRQKEGTTKAKGRTPKTKDYRSWKETEVARKAIYPERYGKGYDPETGDSDWDILPNWVSWPEVVVWVKGEWQPLNRAVSLLKKHGISKGVYEPWIAGRDVPTKKVRQVVACNSGWEYKTVTMYLSQGGWTTKKPQGPILGQTTWQAKRALGTPDKGDVLETEPFISKDKGTPMVRYTLHPSTGIWDASFYLAMWQAKVYIAYRVVVVDGPEEKEETDNSGSYVPQRYLEGEYKPKVLVGSPYINWDKSLREARQIMAAKDLQGQTLRVARVLWVDQVKRARIRMACGM